MQPILSIPKGSPSPTGAIGALVDSAKSLYCNYLNNPVVPIPDDTPAGWLRNGLKNAVGCTPPPPPNPTPDRQYNTPQGKCPGAIIRFDIPYSYNIIRPNGTTTPFSSVGGGGGYPTPIVNIREVRSGGPIQFFGDVGVPGTSGYRQNALLGSVPLPAANEYSGLQYQVNMVPVSGNPDSCPNPAPTYPRTPTRNDPVPPPSYSFPPVVVVPIRPEVKIPVSVNVNFTNNGGINFRFANSIDVNIGPNSINVYLNPTANIDLFPDAPAPGYELPPGYPDPPTGNNGSEGTDSPEDDACLEALDGIDALKDLLEELKACACPDAPPPNITEQLVASGNNGSIAVPTNCIAVKVRLVDVPDNPKQEWGGGNAPDVYYAGWASFGRFLGQSKRDPLDYLSKVFFPPAGSSTFSWTCRQFYSAEVTLVLRN